MPKFKSKTEQVIDIMNQEAHTHNEELLLWEIEKLQLANQVLRDTLDGTYGPEYSNTQGLPWGSEEEV